MKIKTMTMTMNFRPMLLLFVACICMTSVFTSCSNDDDNYILQQADVKLSEPDGGFKALVGEAFTLTPESVSDDGVSYEWFLDSESISTSKILEYTFEQAGTSTLKLVALQAA
ncbi:MAG: PKD-like domain-containing protein, partial [Bacteroidales bacterium]